MRLALSLAACLTLSAPAAADLRDLVLSENGDVAWVQLVFDEVPASVRLEEGEGVSLLIEGAAAAPGLVTPVSNNVIDSASLVRNGETLQVAFDLQPGWHAPQARIENGRVILRLERDPAAIQAGADAAADARLVAPSELAAQMPVETEASAAPDADPAARVPVDAVLPNAAETGPEDDAADAAATEPAAAACEAADARITDDPWDLDAMIVQAECARSGGNAAQAAELLERVTAMDPERFSALLMLAEIEAERGDSDAARALYELAAGAARTDGEAAAARARMRALGE